MTENDNKRKEEKKKCEDKVSYRTFSEANYVRRTYGKDQRMSVYKCPLCFNFHIKKKNKK